MKLVTKLSIFVVVMLGLTMSGAFLSVWSARQADFYLKRIGLANKVYAANLKLSNHTYQLFKQFGDVLIVGRGDNGESKAQLIKLIRADIATIRDLIGQEIQLVGKEEIHELAALSALELQIEQLVKELFSITRSDATSDIGRNWGRLSTILDGDIDRDFRTRIETALEEEANDVAETHAEAEELLVFHQTLSVFFAIVAFITAIFSFFVLKRSLQLRLTKLSEGAKRLSSGELSHRIAATGRDELTGLALTLNHLAERIGHREETLRTSNEELEQKVKDRTKRLETLLGEVRKAEANRTRLMADVSHELRTPLTVIRGEADIALRGSKSLDDFREALSIIRDAATHTARIVDDLLFVARNEAGETRLNVADTDILPILMSFAGSNGIRISMLTDIETAPLRCDEGRIRQAFLILIENARHYGGDTIEIRIDPSPSGYRIAVEDNGPGMSETEKENAFERFFRGSNAAERYGEGAGLGLPVSKSIIEAHGGRILLEDRPAGGLSAVVILPSRRHLKAVS